MGKHDQTIGSTIKEESLLQVTTHTHTHTHTHTGEITLSFTYHPQTPSNSM